MTFGLSRIALTRPVGRHAIALGRIRVAVSLLLGLPSMAAPARAQRTPPAVWDGPRMALHTILGAYLPVGSRREEFANAAWIGLQGVIRMRAAFALVGGVAGAQTAARWESAPKTELTIWQIDVGAESAAWTSASANRRAAVFTGAGAGVRVYDYRGREPPRHSALVGYLSAGVERQPGVGRGTGIRAEGRAYFSHAESSGATGVRAEAVMTLGLTHHFR